VWQVNGVTGGSSSVGTISTNGLYTAPNLPPTGGTVTITAVEQNADNTSGSAGLTIAFSPVSLNGSYVFSLQGFNQGKPFAETGEFTADGKGHLSNLLVDSNDGASVQTKTSLTGSYSVLALDNGTGYIFFGALQCWYAFQAGGSAQLLSISGNAVLTGEIWRQDASATSMNMLTGAWVLAASGRNAASQAITRLALLNTIASSSIPSGTEDVNGPAPLTRTAVSGSYTFDGSAHGTLSVKDTGTHLFSFYVISASQLALLSDDPSTPVTGDLYAQQPIVYSAASLDDPYVFTLSGASLTGNFVQAGQFNPDGMSNLGSVTEDINMPGNLQPGLQTGGTYTFDGSANGRGTLVINNQGSGAPQAYVFYLISPQQAQIMSSNSAVAAAGTVTLQTGGNIFTNAQLNSNYSLVLASQTGQSSVDAILGNLLTDGTNAGILGGYIFQNNNGQAMPAVMWNGNYLLSGGVRGTATLTVNGNKVPFALYPITDDEFVMIGTSASSPYFGLAINQY
ncbi:MAG: hypothetical protein KGJ17_02285, partial [Gammaproteobacteria bacterium]|nr:hypothetical protein [Gammaproteobacteria bacterium]